MKRYDDLADTIAAVRDEKNGRTESECRTEAIRRFEKQDRTLAYLLHLSEGDVDGAVFVYDHLGQDEAEDTYARACAWIDSMEAATGSQGHYSRPVRMVNPDVLADLFDLPENGGEKGPVGTQCRGLDLADPETWRAAANPLSIGRGPEPSCMGGNAGLSEPSNLDRFLAATADLTDDERTDLLARAGAWQDGAGAAPVRPSAGSGEFLLMEVTPDRLRAAAGHLGLPVADDLAHLQHLVACDAVYGDLSDDEQTDLVWTALASRGGPSMQDDLDALRAKVTEGADPWLSGWSSVTEQDTANEVTLLMEGVTLYNVTEGNLHVEKIRARSFTLTKFLGITE